MLVLINISKKSYKRKKIKLVNKNSTFKMLLFILYSHYLLLFFYLLSFILWYNDNVDSPNSSK